MTFILDAQSDKPVRIFQMDDSTPLQDYSPNNGTATNSATPPSHPALVKGASYAPVYDNDITASYDCPVFIQGKESSPFTLESWVYPVEATGGTQLLTNGDFETNTTGWSTAFSTVLSADSAWSDTGTKALKITPDGTNNDSFAEYTSWPQLAENETYVIEATVRITAAQTGTLFALARSIQVFQDPGGLSFTATAPNVAGVYRLKVTFTTPLLAAVTRFRVYNGSSKVAEPIWWDNIVVYRKTKTNRCINPSFETNTTNFGTNQAAISSSNDWSAEGTQSMKIVPDASGIDSFGFLTTSITLVRGRTYTVSATVKIPKVLTGSLSTHACCIDIWNGDFSTLYESTQPASLIPGVYRVSVTFTVPGSGNNTYQFRFYNGSNAATDIVYWDAITIEDSLALSPYYDGDYENAVWTGTAQNSTSVLTLNPYGPQAVLSHETFLDGLTLDGTVARFTTKYKNSPDATCSYDLQTISAAHVVGVHSESKNSLYVNGVLVDEFALTTAQQADSYMSPATTVGTGMSNSNQSVAVNGVAFYSRALSADAVARHFTTGRTLPQPVDIVPAYAGDYIPLSLGNSNLFLDQWTQTADDWNLGVYDNTAVYKDQLVPTADSTGVSVAGAWYKSVGLESSNATTVYGVQLSWDGVGATVQVSLDGVTWETVTRGKNCTTVPAGTTTSGKVLQIRITFPGGTLNDESYVDNLNVVGLTTAASLEIAGRTITSTLAHPEREHDFAEYSDHYGIEIDAGGTVVISADALGASVARTLEVFIKRQGANPTLSMTGTNYINGATGSATLIDGQWALMHIVAGADVTGTITINGPCQVGYVGIYDTALSAGTIAAIYSDYVGTDAPRVADASVISVAESTNAANIYQHDWSIAASG